MVNRERSIIEFLDNKLEKEIDKKKTSFGVFKILERLSSSNVWFVFISVEVKDEIRLYIHFFFLVV